MFGQGQMLNKRPNMKVFNHMHASRDIEDDDDDPDMSSFTKSKVDDDDDKFKNRSDQDFIDFLQKKKALDQTPPKSTVSKQLSRFDTPASPVILTPKGQVAAKIFDTPIQPEKKKTSLRVPQTEPKSKITSEVKLKTPEIKKIVPEQKEKPTTTPVIKQEEPDALVQNININEKIGDLIRPQFVRKGKTTGTVVGVAKKVGDGEGDNLIRAIEPRNPRDISRDYVIQNNPNYYGTQKQYEDPLFPANLSQLYQIPKNIPTADAEKISFSRVEEKYVSRAAETLSVVDPNDITPGQFETWNLLSSLASIAEQPTLISRILEDQRINIDGYYYVRLCENGVWRFLIVDDILPYNNDKAMYSSPSQDLRMKKLAKTAPGYKCELWVSLIEKGISKMFGSYEDIEKNVGSIKDDMYILTGAPTFEYKLDALTTTDLHNRLIKNDPQNIVIFQTTKKEKIQIFRDKMNESHVFGYALISYDANKQLLRLRNPWGWIKDPLKAQTITKMVGEEGEFTISTADTIKYFDLATITNYHDDYYTISMGVRQLPNSYSAYNFTVRDTTQCFFTYSQLDKRYFRNNLVEKYNYSFARLMVFDQDDKLIGSIQGIEKEISVGINIEAGRFYSVVVCIDWIKFKKESECPHDSTLTYYGSNDCVIQRSNQIIKPNKFAELLSHVTMNKGEKRNFGTSSPNFNKNISEYIWIGQDERLIGITWWNQSDQAISYSRDFQHVVNKDQLIPLCFVNSKDIKQAIKLTSSKMNLMRMNAWWQATLLEVDFPPNSLYSVVFKPKDLDQECNKDFVQEMALI